MKAILFFICMMLCAIEVTHAEVLAGMRCTDGEAVHVFHGESDDRNIIYIDGVLYNYVSDHTVGDISYTKYEKESDPDEFAFINVDVYEDNDTGFGSTQVVKLVLHRHGEKIAKFGGFCNFE